MFECWALPIVYFLFYILSCYQCSERDFVILIVLSHKGSKVCENGVAQREQLQNKCTLSLLTSKFVRFSVFVYILLPFLKEALANPVADPGQSPGAASVVISLSRSVD